jgi:hypothetical protein
MGRSRKYYTAKQSNPEKTAHTRCRWCHKDFIRIRGHLSQTNNCQLLEIESKKKKRKTNIYHLIILM